MTDQNEGEAVGTKAKERERENMMLGSRESRLMLWELLRLRYPWWKLTQRLIPDEIKEELQQVLNTFLPGKNKSIFKKWQRMRLWPPPEVLHDCREQGLEHPND